MIRAMLTEEMERRRLTQRALAQELGCEPSLVSKWLMEDGGSVPSPRYCTRLAEVFGYTPEEVLRLAGHLPGVAEGSPEKEVDIEKLAMQRAAWAVFEEFDRSRWRGLLVMLKSDANALDEALNSVNQTPINNSRPASRPAVKRSDPGFSEIKKLTRI